MTEINIYTDTLPAGATVRHVAGDWLTDGYIDNLNRQKRFTCVVSGGRVFEIDGWGYVDLAGPALPIVSEGIAIRGTRIAFSASRAELARCNVVCAGA